MTIRLDLQSMPSDWLKSPSPTQLLANNRAAIMAKHRTAWLQQRSKQGVPKMRNLRSADFDDHRNKRQLYRHLPDDILKDGERLRVPVRMMDTKTGTSRVDIGALADGLTVAEHRNGWRLHAPATKDSAVAERKALYDSYDQELSTAYLKDDTATASAWREDYPGATEGDICTVRGSGYPDSMGEAGHLEYQEGCLVCVPDSLRDAKPRAADAKTDAKVIRDAAHAAYEHDLSNQWREPIKDHTPVNNPKRRTAGVILHDTRESAIADYNAELENAYKNGRV